MDRPLRKAVLIRDGVVLDTTIYEKHATVDDVKSYIKRVMALPYDPDIVVDGNDYSVPDLDVLVVISYVYVSGKLR